MDGIPPPAAPPETSKRRAADLLGHGAAALERGAVPEAQRAAAELMTCCAAARDEFGVSYALYASWQMVTISRRQPGQSREGIVRSLTAAIERGLLDRPADVSGVHQLAEQLGDVPGASELAAAVQKQVDLYRCPGSIAATARAWMAELGSLPRSSARVIIAAWPDEGASTLGALWNGPQGHRGVLVIDPAVLARWIGRWSAEDTPFTFTLGQTPAAAGHAVSASLILPLWPDTPDVEVVARGPSTDEGADRRRDRLFTAAAGAVVVLTLLAGGLAARDVIRERKLAVVRSAFLAGVTHEIKTPITSICLMAETLLRGRADPGSSGELLGTIVNEAAHLSDMVDNLLSTSRIESGARTYRPRVVLLGDAMHEVKRRLAYTLSKENFTLLERIPDEPILVHVDPEALAQAIMNLLGNAMKYSGQSREIGLSVETDGARARVHVIDYGVGIPSQEQDRIFASFYRTATAAASTTGSGLGLALVRHFARAHGGDVWVESQPGRGSVFTLVLPRAAESDTRRG